MIVVQKSGESVASRKSIIFCKIKGFSIL